MNKLIAALLVSLTATSAAATSEGPRHRMQKLDRSSISAATLAATRSLTVAVNGLAVLVLGVSVTEDNDAAPNITVTCTGKLIDGSTSYTLQDLGSPTAGAYTASGLSVVKTITQNATTSWPVRVDVLGYSSVTCSFATSSTDAGDLITVEVDGVAE